MAEEAATVSPFKWSKEQTEAFIKLRNENCDLFTGVNHSAAEAWRIILETMDLQGKVTPLQAKKKWNNIKKKYKGRKDAGSGEGFGGKPLTASMSEGAAGPSSAVGDQEDGAGRQQRKRKLDRSDELFELIREDMRQQREAEERRANENTERMERLFEILERIANK